MSVEGSRAERRRHRRADLPITAVVFRAHAAVGRYLVQNLSAGGALLTGRREVEPGERIRVLLPLPGGQSVVLDALVVRRAHATNELVALAVTFDHESPVTEDVIQEALLSAVVDLDRRERPAVLVVEDCEEIAQRLAAGLRGLGRRVLTASTPLDAVQRLEDPEEHVDTALVDVSVGEMDGLELVSFLREEHPEVRRVLVQGSVRPSAAALMQAGELVHAILTPRWDEAELAQAMLP